MRIGYARTSTVDQEAGLEAQERDLLAAGCEKAFVEQLSSVAKRRPQLEAALEFVREGDEFVVTRLDRLARSTKDLIEIAERLTKKGVGLRVLNSPIDTTTATGQFMLEVLGAVAQLERRMMLERQREGVAKAKAAGKYKGRARTAQAKAPEVLQLKAEGVKPTEIAKRLRIGRASVYRIIGEKEAA